LLGRLLLLFIIVPAVELILLIEIGQVIGTLPTIGLIVFTGILGAFLARRQGVQVLSRIRRQMQSGQLPADPIFDGAIILVAGALLMTPGILTDTLGFLCLIPATRRVLKKAIWSRVQRMIQNGQIITNTYQGRPYQPREEDVIIIDHDDYA
jgi:UPF0716 protein FxsA